MMNFWSLYPAKRFAESSLQAILMNQQSSNFFGILKGLSPMSQQPKTKVIGIVYKNVGDGS